MTPRLIAILFVAAACSAPPPEPPLQRELRSVSGTGTDAFVRGDLRVASASFRRVLELARMLDDGHEVGNAAYNLAWTHLEAGDTDGAQGLIAEARAAFARAGEPTADVDLLDARIAAHSGRIDTAYASMAELADTEDAPQQTRVRALLRMVDLDLARGQVATARRTLDRARAAAGDDAESPLVLEGTGRVQLAEGDAVGAAETFDREAGELAARRLPRAMADALDRAGDAWSAAGRPEPAADRWLRAAGAQLALHDVGRARAAAERAHAAADAIGHVELVTRADALLAEASR